MPLLAYETKRFSSETLAAIETANEILEEYAQQNYDLTLRQLFYQHVARGLIPNTDRSYKRLGSIVNDARMAGYIDWDYIVDRTRNVREVTHWDNPAHIIRATAGSYRNALWDNQDCYVEVWIEKDALVGVIEGVCRRYDVPFFSCRGYTSQSEMWASAQRILPRVLDGKDVTILHLGDHDPSGIDMSRDIEARLRTFIAHDYLREQGATNDTPQDEIKTQVRDAMGRFHVERIALTMAQVRQYNPPPNPAKLTDSRATGYIQKHGNQSWELDALDPPVLNALIVDEVEARIAWPRWQDAIAAQQRDQRLLKKASSEWAAVAATLQSQLDDEDEQEDDDA